MEAFVLKRLLLPVVAAALLAVAGNLAWADDPSTAAETPKPAETTTSATKPNEGDTAWMLVSTGLVLLMVPGLALFYGGMVRRKNILGTMMHSMVALALIGLQW